MSRVYRAQGHLASVSWRLRVSPETVRSGPVQVRGSSPLVISGGIFSAASATGYEHQRSGVRPASLGRFGRAVFGRRVGQSGCIGCCFADGIGRQYTRSTR
ncbi:hypothetical protein Rhow_007840 [Rhodococcus wratislaviensis]|uniref:Uncharacterized protein n=1 Tax=Rhodococcus wratislaviensis TaxID=44752 RepID=A0A402CIY2_RHOWR|nr:hypothetical protein Rhow_007840 [Rhodococcus wratislaviensis]